MERNHSIDSLRGIFLIIMTINHLIWVTGGRTAIQYVTLQPFGQVGAAEGFIFISGLLIGMIYHRYSLTDARTKLWTRAKEIYSYHIIAIIMIVLLATLYMKFYPSTETLFQYNFSFLLSEHIKAGVLSLFLIHKPNYFDILPMYVVFILLSPFVLYQLKQGHWHVVIITSLILWLTSDYLSFKTLSLDHVFPEQTNTGYFHWLAWQLLFFSGMTLGYLDKSMNIQWFKYKSIIITAAILALLIFSAHRGLFHSFNINQMTLYQQANKPTLGWLRVFNLALLVYLLSFLISCKPSWLAIKPLALLGRHSLLVFSWHYLLIFGVAPIITMIEPNYEQYNLLILASTLLLFIPVILRESSYKQLIQRNVK